MPVFSGFNRRDDFQNQYITQINRESAHSAWGAYENEASARKRENSKYALSLNGTWEFFLCNSPDEVPEDFWTLDERFTPISVPGNWELQGFSKPVYTNSIMPFPDDPSRRYMQTPSLTMNLGSDCRYRPPMIPEDTLVGLYRKRFTLPEAFSGRKTYLHFDGVESAYYLYVNGDKVGYSEDSKLPSEFEITPYLRPGENTVALAVFRFSDGSWLEDQDYLYLSGIYRPVTLFSKPDEHILDVRGSAAPVKGRTYGEILARCELNRETGYADRTVRLRAYDPEGKLVAEDTGIVNAVSPIYGKQMGGHVRRRPECAAAAFLLRVEKPLLWDTDHPNLYTLTFTLLDADGREEDFESCRVGFRRVEIENNVIKLNGKRVVFRGVDRHEHAYETGRYVSHERMIQEICLMKQLNFNAVRTCHYPDAPEWYDLCDEYGLMIVCEANVESHAVQGTLTTDPEWAEAMLERARRMAVTHKNHPCIVSWSLGNESGVGANHAGMAGWLRGYDDTRLVQYEGNDSGKTVSDIKCTMYPPVPLLMDMIADNDDPRPIVLIEHTYQIANTTGNYAQFNELTEKYERFQGGFVWDWQDKCLPAYTEDGREFVGFGGDWGEDFVETTVPKYMCANGVVTADLRPKPGTLEMKQGHTPVSVELYHKNRGVLLVRNRLQSTDYDELEIRYTVTENGVPVLKGVAKPILEEDPIRLAAAGKGCKERDTQPWPALFKDGDRLFVCDLEGAQNLTGEAFLNVSVVRKTGARWCEAGFSYTDAQFALKGRKAFCPKFEKGNLTVARTGNELTVSDGECVYVFSADEHALLSLTKNGKEYLSRSGNIQLFRARTGMFLEERWGGDMQTAWDAFRPGKLQRKPVSVRVTEGDPATVRFEDEYESEKGKIVSVVEWSLHAGDAAEVNVRISMDEDFGWIPRAGVSFTVPEGFEKLKWFGRGPGESYPDRKLASPVGLYECSVEDTHFPFVPVSHNGSHSDTRWMRLTDKDGHEIEVSGPLFSFDAHHNTPEDYFAVLHEHELVRRPEISLIIDGYVSGIGGDMAWSNEYNPVHMLKAGTYRFDFVLKIR